MASVWKVKKQNSHTGTILSVLFFLTVLTAFIRGLNDGSESAREEQRNSLQNAIVRATVHCYAIEGQYPQSIEYLEENYGITIDDDKYIVSYSGFASNVMPIIEVYDKKS